MALVLRGSAQTRRAPQDEGQQKSFSRRIGARALPTTTNEERRTTKERSGAPRGASSHGRILSDTAARLARTRSPFGAPLRRLPERANAPAQSRPRFTRARGCGRYPHRHSRLSKAPCAPVVMPAGHGSGYLPVCICANCVHRSDTRIARERGYEPRPQEPHPLRFRDRLEKRPS